MRSHSLSLTLAESIRRKIHRFLHKAFVWAVDEGIMSHNPAYRAFVPIRDGEDFEDDDPKKMQILTEEERG